MAEDLAVGGRDWHTLEFVPIERALGQRRGAGLGLQVAIAQRLGGLPGIDALEADEQPWAVLLTPGHLQGLVAPFRVERAADFEAGWVVAQHLDADRPPQTVNATHQSHHQPRTELTAGRLGYGVRAHVDEWSLS